MFAASTLLVATQLLFTSINCEPTPIRINCGSNQDVNIDGVTWDADRNFFGWFDAADSTNAPVDTLYQTFRDAWWPGVSYSFNLNADAAGDYIINLYFAEVEKNGPNQRTFDILINGAFVASNFDIFSEAGGANLPLIKTYQVNVPNNNLQIVINFRREFSDISNALINAIEILPVDTTPVTTWVTGTPFLYEVGEVSAVAVDDQGYYLFGGNPSEASGLGFYYEGISYYDIATATWTEIDPFVPFFAQADHQTPQAYNGKIYSFGGGNFVVGNFMRVFDPAVGEWVQLAELLVDGIQWLSQSPSSALIGNKIYIAGGIVQDDTVDRVFEYDITNNIWTEKASMPDGGRNHAAGVGYNGLFYLFGGRKGGNFPNFGFTDSFVYDPNINAWSSIAPMLEGTGGAGQAVIMNGRLIVIGGEDCCDALDKVQAYDPLTDSWEFLPEMITPRHGIAPVAIGNSIYVAAGGTDAGFSQSTTHEILLFL